MGPVELSLEVGTEGASGHVDVAVRNVSDQPLRLESAVVGFRWRGCDTSELRFLRNGWQSWSFTGACELDDRGTPEFPSGAWLRGLHHAVGARPADRSGWHDSELVTVAGSSRGGACCLLGVLERGRAFGVLELRREGTQSLLLEAELWLDAVLAPGERRPLERVSVALGEDASELLETFGAAHGALAEARSSAPFVSGWCSWYHYFHEVSESDVLRNLDALAAARPELPVEVVQVDDGYQRAVGDWLDSNERFPRGLAPLAADIRAAGFVPGLWTAPFCAVTESALFQKHRDWLLTSGGEPHRGLLHPAWSRDASVFVLDASRPAVTDHLERVYAALVEMGFAYLKLDFLYTAAMRAEAADPGLGRAARLRRGLDAIRSGAGEEAFLLGCGCPLGAAVGVVDGMRVGPDVAPGWHPDPTLAIPGIEETLPATRSAVRSSLARAWMHRRLWLNDPDCLLPQASPLRLPEGPEGPSGPGSALSPAEVRTLATTIAATGGMFLFSADLPRLPAEARALLAEALEVARSVDGMGLPGAARVLDPLGCEEPTATLARGGETVIAALVNTGEALATGALDAAAAGLAPLAGPARPLLGSPAPEARGGALEVALEPHGSSLLRLQRQVRLAVFCDFDGTFSVQDVGATLAQRHAADLRPQVWARYERREVTAWEYNMEVLHGLVLSRSEVDDFLRSVEIDPGARELVAWCEAHGVPFRVLSDGFDANLNRLQQLFGVRFAFDANELRYDRGRWRLRAGHPNPHCECGTGTCKRGRLEAFRARHPEARLVHIGNGRVSDLCGALAADHVFAKDSLALELSSRGVAFSPFETLREVVPALAALLAESAPG